VLVHELLIAVTQKTKWHWDTLSLRLPVSIRELPVSQFSMPLLLHLPLKNLYSGYGSIAAGSQWT